jgi:cytochrome c oxidase subunit 3
MASHAAAHDTNENLWQGGQEPFKASYGKLMMWYFLISDAFTFAGFLIAYGALRFSMPTWPMPDFVFSAFPGLSGHYPLLFVTVMTFVLIASSVTMVRAVQEGQVGNKNGVVFWMLLTVVGGACFLGCQAFEWTTLIVKENMTVTQNPFGRHTADGTYTDNLPDSKDFPKTFKAGDTYLIHGHEHNGKVELAPRPFKTTDGREGVQELGPKAFGALFFFITGFHGFHVFSGVAFLTIIMINVASGLYHNRGNHYEMVEKIGLYWHFVDLVWVFVFLAFYLL